MASQGSPANAQPPCDTAAFWYGQAARVQRKVNGSWWLQFFCPMLLVISLTAAGGILTERYLYAHSHYGWAGFGIAMAIAMCICLWWAKPRFYSRRDGLVHLEAALRLHNRLSAAHAGIGPWPPAQTVRDGLRWRWLQLIWPVAIAGVALHVAAWIPLQAPLPPLPIPAQPPMAWERIETALDTLEQSGLLQGKAMDVFRDPLTQLQQQPSEQWYTHHTLEASDALRTQLEHTLEGLEHQLQHMTSALDSLAQSSETDSNIGSQLRDSFNQTRDQLALGRMPLNEQVLDTLNTIDSDSLQGLSQDELSALKEQLRQGTATIRDAKRHSRYGRQLPLAEPENGLAENPCPFDRHEDCVLLRQPGESGQMGTQGMRWGGEAGQGGITRGPGSAPLALDPQGKKSRAGHIEVIQGADMPDENDDYTRKFGRSAPKVNRSQAHALSLGGAAQGEGDRATTVWKHTFTPEERDVLEHFFK
ncbi:hypothetical protein [Candidatus Entotheonella palauensis]|uniref:hypothetical protein n=1 Tax=Candidatus Entotheonella palauensis TaxID=93172 RepID=UPI000B7EED5F|nr:hypothetical protein [Candidatus Entotheonella palauensis]